MYWNLYLDLLPRFEILNYHNYIVYLFYIFPFQSEKEDMEAYCRKSVYPELVVAYGKADIVLTLGGKIVATLSKPAEDDRLMAKQWATIWLHYFAVFYAFHLQYPTGYEIGLMIIQKESMNDDIHAGPLTKTFEKEYSKFQAKA